MPFKKGLAPVRRSLKYLESSRLVLKDRVKVFTVNYNEQLPNHKGARDFVFWHLAQLQYKNPHVHVLTIPHLTPTPFIRIFTKSEDILVDIDGKTRDEINQHIKKILCKTDEKLQSEALEQQKVNNPANFGWGCDRQCLCEVMGQVPCPGVVPLPKTMRKRYHYGGTNLPKFYI